MGATKKWNACSVLKPLPPTYHPAQAATIVCNDSPCGAIPLRSIGALRKPLPAFPTAPVLRRAPQGTMQRSGIAPVDPPPGGRKLLDRSHGHHRSDPKRNTRSVQFAMLVGTVQNRHRSHHATPACRRLSRAQQGTMKRSAIVPVDPPP